MQAAKNKVTHKQTNKQTNKVTSSLLELLVAAKKHIRKMPIMNDQYHLLGENGAASHQSIVHNQSVAELNIQVAFF